MAEFEQVPGGPPGGDAPRAEQPAGPGTPRPFPSGDEQRRPRRRGRRGRGGGGFVPDGPARFGQGRPFRGPPPAARPPREAHDDEGSSQTRDVAAYERRQQQDQRRGAGGFRPGGQWRSGGQRRFAGGGNYGDAIRRVTAGPRSAAPSHEAGEPIAGPHAVLEALRSGRALRKLYISQDRGTRTGAVNEIIAEAQQRRIFVNFVDKLEIARLSPVENHQGVVAIVEGRAGVDLDELLLHLDALSGPALVLVLDSLQDPQNFGALLRSAEGAGVDGVVIPRHRSVGLTAAVAKTSAGASEHLLVADVPNLRQAIDALKEKGIWVVATDESGELLYDEVDYRGPTALVIGGEGEGIRRLVLEGCDQVVRIPMEGQVASLNAAAAGSVVLYEALRQRRRDVAPPDTQTPRPEPTSEEGEDLQLAAGGDDNRAADEDVVALDAAEDEKTDKSAER